MELLAPAGSWEALRAAVSQGADAVYLGGRSFTARAGAENFADLGAAVEYCGLRGVKVYLALNTLIKDSEMGEALALAKEAARTGVAALILQDLGLARRIRDCCPGMPLHASTQLGTHNPEGVAALRKLGFCRAILARETSLADAEAMAGLGMELEMFVHGALCVGFSGQCLLSSLIGGRSGNRGRCAQPCRLPWRYRDGEREAAGYRLSTRDLCLAWDLTALKQAGVASLKIEGRLRRPEYVAVTVNRYRRALDAAEAGASCPLDEEDLRQLKLAYHRGGFCRGYAFGVREEALMDPSRANHGGVLAARVLAGDRVEPVGDGLREGDGVQLRNADGSGDRGGMTVGPLRVQGRGVRLRLPPEARPGDTLWKTADAEQLHWAAETVRRERRVPAQMRATLAIGAPLAVELHCGGIAARGESDLAVQAARGRPLAEDEVRERLGRMGDTVYELTDLDLAGDDNAFLPVGQLNLARRRAAEELDRRRLAALPRPAWREEAARGREPWRAPARPRLAVQAMTPEQIRAAVAAGAEEILVQPRRYERAALEELLAAAEGAPAYLILPPVTFRQDLEQLPVPAGYAGLYTGGLGADERFAALPRRGDIGWNLTNRQAVAAALDRGLERVTLSPELNLREMNELAATAPCELIAYGRLPLMQLVHCPRRAAGTACRDGRCAGDREFAQLTDRRGETFLLRKCRVSRCVNQVLNAHILHLAPQAGKIRGMAALRLLMAEETPERVAAVVRGYRAVLAGEAGDFRCLEGLPLTAGHGLRGVE